MRKCFDTFLIVNGISQHILSQRRMTEYIGLEIFTTSTKSSGVLDIYYLISLSSCKKELVLYLLLSLIYQLIFTLLNWINMYSNIVLLVILLIFINIFASPWALLIAIISSSLQYIPYSKICLKWDMW